MPIRNVDRSYQSSIHLLFDEMTVNLDVFCLVMLNTIMCNTNGRFIVRKQLHRAIILYLQILSDHFIYNSLQIPNEIALNLLQLAFDRATTLCLLLLQTTRFPLKKVQYFKVDLLSLDEPV
jgi:hypothetical protein